MIEDDDVKETISILLVSLTVIFLTLSGIIIYFIRS
jgi:phage shock protein PspC (stress-responsive transcriptional regulator)